MLEYDELYSVTIRDDKIIAIYNTFNAFKVKFRVFELKEGTTRDIYNGGKTYTFGCPDPNFALVLLDAPEHLPEVKNKLWLKFNLVKYSHNPTTSPLINWVGYINLDDMSFKNDSSFIKFPTHENFPVKDYTMNTITNEFGSALYITGGELYSKESNSYLDSNSFYKYNFTTKEWIDMTYSTNGKLKPLFDHRSVVIDNRYLAVLGGKRRNSYNSTYESSDKYLALSEYDLEHDYNSLYNLTIFDAHTNKWKNVNIKADMFYADVAALQFYNFIAAPYEDKAIVFSGVTKGNRTKEFDHNGYFAILDLKSELLDWVPIKYDEKILPNNFLIVQDPKMFNNQLIICTSKLKFIIRYSY
jgi:hypothetical protein